jgi:hydrogenase nickel incorporation protein HypA/HybF
MHEFSIACGLVEKLLDFTYKNPEKRIVEVLLEVGELSHIATEQLTFDYDSIIKDTPIEGSTLRIEKVDAAVNCSHCGYHGQPSYWNDAIATVPVLTLRCPTCGKAADASQGQECAIRSIKFREEQALSP